MRRFTPCFLLTANCFSIADANAEDLTVAASLGFESHYVFRGVQFAETSIEPAVTLVSIWARGSICRSATMISST